MSKQYKVERLLEKYELHGLGATLEDRWTRDHDRWSLRDLAEWLNQRLLEQAMRDAGVQVVDGELTNSYRLLTADDVSEGDRVQLRRRFERAGMDVDDVRNDFVTYQAIRSYLQEVRGATRPRVATATAESVQQQINRLVGRTTSVIEGKLTQLKASGKLRIGDFRLLIDVRVYCHECDTQYGVTELLAEGSCACPAENA